MEFNFFKKNSAFSKKWIQMHLNSEDPLLKLNPECEKISCVQGKLWVTSPTSGVDIVLSAGETLDVDQLESVLIEAMGDADIGVFTHWHH